MIDREKLPTYYPKKGFGEFPEKICEQVRKHDGQVQLNAFVTKIVKHRDNTFSVHYQQDGVEKIADASQVISTIPINKLIPMLEPAVSKETLSAALATDYVALITVNIFVKKTYPLGCGYMYTLGRLYNRVTDLNSFSPDTSPEGITPLMFEISTVISGELWHLSNEELYHRTAQDAIGDKLFSMDQVVGYEIIRTKDAYPMYTKDFAGHVGFLRKATRGFSKHVHILGRTGEFIYMDSDTCVGKALALAAKVLKYQKIIGTNARKSESPAEVTLKIPNMQHTPSGDALSSPRPTL